MGGQRGRDVVVRIGDGSEFVTVAGLRARTISLSTRLVETTTAQSAEAWRELIASAGTKRIEIAGSGVFSDAASDARLRAAYFAGEAPVFQLAVASFGVLEGPFAIGELVYAGEHDAEALFSIRLVSAGAVSFEAI